MNYIQYKGPWTKETYYSEDGKKYSHIGIHVNKYYNKCYDDISFNNENEPVSIIAELSFKSDKEDKIYNFVIGKTGILEIDDCNCTSFTINPESDKIEGFIEVEVEDYDG